MRRYYVTPNSGMTSDAEFVIVRDQIMKDKLIVPGEGRDRRRRRWPDGRVTEQAFLHLWTTRKEAEAFASRLPPLNDGQHWEVVEVDVEGTIDEVLDPAMLPLPSSPKVISIQSWSFVDSLGDDALRVLVTIEEKPTGELYEWEEVSEIHEAIHEALASEKIDFYPYVRFQTSRDEARQSQGV